MKLKKKKRGLLLVVLSLLLLPGLEVLLMVGFNSSKLIKFPIFIAIIVLIILFTLLLIKGLGMYFKNKGASKRRLRKWIKAFFTFFMILYISGCVTLVVLLYGPSDKFKIWLITTAMATMNHQYLCEWFYSEDQINEVLNKNYIKESGESTDPSLIGKDKEEKVEYNEYEKELLEHEEGETYKIVQFEVNGARAFIAAVFDPSMVRVEVTEKVGVIGEYVTHMVARNNAVLGINAGGFVDAGNNLGESPTGVTIVNGEIVTNNEYGVATSTGGIVGMTEDNVLVLLKDVTGEEALEMGVRDAVSWGPFLIVNGVSSEVSGNGGWGGGARTAIGQRKDGTILFLVVESNTYRTNGAGMEDLVAIMERYGAYNAANMDGGTSSVMVVPRNVAINEYGADCHDYFSQEACNINDPIDATGTHQTRYIATSWIVVE